jgi:type IV fimbrial biogenesis protein FimT
MCNIERQARKNFSKWFPFICSIKPFVLYKKPCVLPFIDLNIPLVGNKGFTLIELIVTLTVAGILMAIAAPNMFGFLASNRLTAQTNDFIADINFARSEAIKRNGTVVICKSTNPTATTPTCDQTASDPWETGRLIFFDNEDSSAGISLNYKYLSADNDVLLRIRESLNGNSTLRPNSPSVSPNLSNYLAYTKYGLTTLAAPTTGDGPHRFKVCDQRGKVRGLLLETTGRTSLVSDNATTFTWSGTTYTLTCP